MAFESEARIGKLREAEHGDAALQIGALSLDVRFTSWMLAATDTNLTEEKDLPGDVRLELRG